MRAPWAVCTLRRHNSRKFLIIFFWNFHHVYVTREYIQEVFATVVALSFGDINCASEFVHGPIGARTIYRSTGFASFLAAKFGIVESDIRSFFARQGCRATYWFWKCNNNTGSPCIRSASRGKSALRKAAYAQVRDMHLRPINKTSKKCTWKNFNLISVMVRGWEPVRGCLTSLPCATWRCA